MSKQSSLATTAGGAQSKSADVNNSWQDDGTGSGKKFKFVHIIVVSIIFMLLGSFLAKAPVPSTP